MTRTAVADLLSDGLDIAVALADSHQIRRGFRDALGIHDRWPGGNWEFIRRPSTAWEHGGPIIERARIDLVAGALWRAVCGDEGDVDESPTGFSEGPTPLIAAMRAYINAKFGDAIEFVPTGIASPTLTPGNMSVHAAPGHLECLISPTRDGVRCLPEGVICLPLATLAVVVQKRGAGC